MYLVQDLGILDLVDNSGVIKMALNRYGVNPDNTDSPVTPGGSVAANIEPRVPQQPRPVNQDPLLGSPVAGNVEPGAPQQPSQINQDPLPGEDLAAVTGQEQEAYNKVVMSAMTIMFENERTKTGIVEMLRNKAKKPAERLADISFMMIMQLEQKSGGQIPEDVILPASIEILEQLSDLADSVQAFPVDEAVMNHAGQLLVVRLGEEYGVDREELQSLLGSVDQVTLQQIGAEQETYAAKQPENAVNIPVPPGEVIAPQPGEVAPVQPGGAPPPEPGAGGVI